MREKKDQRVLFGTRKSDKFVRCYQKDELGVFRVELEVHSPLLRKHSIETLDDLIHVPEIICPGHLQFVDLNWTRLRRYLSKKFGAGGAQVGAGALRRAASLLKVRRYLGKRGVVNFHRFLSPQNTENLREQSPSLRNKRF